MDQPAIWPKSATRFITPRTWTSSFRRFSRSSATSELTMTAVKKASTGPRRAASAVMAAAKSSASSAASTAEAAAAAAKARAVSSAGWFGRPVATAP